MLNLASKKTWSSAGIFVLLLLLALPAGLAALPVAVEQMEDVHSIRPTAYYMVDEGGGMSILDASSPLRQNIYSRLEDGIPLTQNGALWLRFSLIKNNQALNAPRSVGSEPPLFLDLGYASRSSRLYVAESVSADGEVRTWREYSPLGGGRFRLPYPELLPLTVYVRLDGIPHLWFDPVLVRGTQEGGIFTWTFIMQLIMGVSLAVVLIRGVIGNEEWRFWAAAILACAMIPPIFGQYGSDAKIIYLTAMPRLLAPGLAVMLIPHLGRYLLRSRPSKALDYTLVALSVPGVLIALAPLVPGLGWTARTLPLAPLLLLPLALITLLRLRRKQSGTFLYLLFILFPILGAALALLTLLRPDFTGLASIGPSLTSLGYMAAGLVMAIGRPGKGKQGDFFPLNKLLDDGQAQSEGGRAPERKAGNAPGGAAPAKQAAPAAKDVPAMMPQISIGEAAGADPAGGSDLAKMAEGLFEPVRKKAPEPENSEDLPGPEPRPAAQLINLGLDEDVFNAPQAVEPEPESAAQPEPVQAEAAPETLPETSPETSPEAAPQAAPLEPPAPLQREAKIIYIKDEEEPGLSILRPAGPEPIAGLSPVHQAQPAHNWEYTAITRLESALRLPYQQLVEQFEGLKSRQELASDYADGLGKSLSGLGLMLDNLERLARGEPLSQQDNQSIFNLSQLIRRIHEELLPLAEERGITLSWFVSPGLPAHFKGPEQELAQAVKFLMHGTLEGAGGGALQLSVRPGAGAYEGQIQFNLQESGMHPEHMSRPSGWLNKAWELAASSGGSFNIDFIPGKGMEICLALPLEPVAEAAKAAAPPEQPPLEMPGAAALAVFAPGPAPEGAEEPLPGPAPGAGAEEEIILLTDAIVAEDQELAPEAPAGAEAEPEPEAEAEMDESPAAAESLVILSDDEMMDVPLSLTSGGVSDPRASASRGKAARAPEPEKGPREYIVIADMAASGRRLLARRLEGLPHKLTEARNADEIIKAVEKHPVGLIIIDADMPESDVKRALEKVGAYNAERSLPPTPSLCILSHESQAERLSRLGCSDTQVKSASRELFRQAVLRLCPHPEADPAELLPENQQPRAAQSAPAEAPPARQAAPPAPEPAAQSAPDKAPKPGRKGKKGGRVPMLDLIVASLDEENEAEPEAGAQAAPQPNACKPEDKADERPLKAPHPLSSSDGEFMEAEMVPLIPGLLIVMEESLADLGAAARKNDAEHVKDVAVRLAGQGRTFGLSTLERMARCVERAAMAGDAEAIRDFSEELVTLGQRYLLSLKETHENYLKTH